MTTIRDVAKKAGVSISVVSKAFNNYADVNEETKQRIFDIAKELNYSPNIVAKNLSSKRQMTIGLITSGVLNQNEKDHNAFDIFKGVYTAVEENEYELSIFLLDSMKQKQKSYVQFCRERNIGGAILQGIRTDDPYFQELVDTNVPCVVFDILPEKDNELLGSVSINSVGASKEIALHLLERNHRDIVIMAGTKETYVNSERLKGVQQAFQDYKLEVDPGKVLYAQFSEKEAYQLAKVYLTTHQPTAFLCFSDLMAFGVMRAVKESGLRVPEDISVTGFDDLVLSGYIEPKLTTIRQDFTEMGRTAAQILQNLMENKQCAKHVNVAYEFIERNSVGKL